MHDPEVLAFSIRRPWPRRRSYGKRALYWPLMIDVWHIDPSGDHLNTCGKKRWRWHVHHWQVNILPLRHLRRWLLTRCEWCGGKSRKRDRVDVSHSWDGPRGRWWRGEPGLFHHDCSTVSSAHITCTCPDPLLERDGWGKCALCGRSRGYGARQLWLTNAALLREAIPPGGRNREKFAQIVGGSS